MTNQIWSIKYGYNATHGGCVYTAICEELQYHNQLINMYGIG